MLALWSVLASAAYGCSLLLPPPADAAPFIAVPRRGNDSLSCEVCKTVSSALELYLQEEHSEDEITEVLAGLCVLFKISDKHLCDAFVKEYKVTCKWSL